MDPAIVVLVTASSAKEAEEISKCLLNEKLAACVNTVKVESVFRWKQKIERAKEVLMLIKTREKLFKKLQKKVKEIHSYEVPEIIALPVIAGYRPYLDWIEQSTRS